MPSAQKPAIALGDVVLERYRVVEQIAAGGHSLVYKGTDERLSRPVCIKVFSGFGGESGVGRTSYEHFVQEAFALSRLTHPNTLRIYDFGHLGNKDQDKAGMPLQVCEFMNGGTLSNVIREQGNQSLPDTTRVVAAMCAALDEAHALGIVHRDIKPQNILFGTVGTTRLPKLADFGIAKWSDDAPENQRGTGKRAEDTAIVAGQKLAMYSPSWAAPEQLAGQPVSPATDIYSLACVAVYMLSTRAIFADEDVYAGYKKRRHAADLVRDTLGPLGVPSKVVELLSHALAFDPKARPGKVDELASALATAVEPPKPDAVPARINHEPTAKLTATRAGVAPPTPPGGQPKLRPITASPEPDTDESDPDPPAVASSAAPTPPAVPAPIAPSWVPPPAVQPWMQGGAAPTGVVHPVPLSDTPVHVASRRVHFVLVTNNVADLVGPAGMKIRVTLILGPTGRVVHVKGLSCFVSLLGGRPSPAVQLDRSGDIALVTPRAQEIGHLRVATGSTLASQWAFPLGDDLLGVAIEDCSDPILFDFGPGSDAYLVYTRGRTLPKRR